MTLPLYWTTVAAQALLGLALIATITGVHRVWPPPGPRSWEYACVWILTGVTILGLAGLGILDWNALGWSDLVRYGLGLPLAAGGFGFTLWGVATLGWRRSSGLGGELVTTGPYRFTRNPQYVGDALGLAGWTLVSGSALVAVTSVGAILLLLATPLAEEPWLAERLGETYERYRRRTPRYIGSRGES